MKDRFILLLFSLKKSISYFVAMLKVLAFTYKIKNFFFVFDVEI